MRADVMGSMGCRSDTRPANIRRLGKTGILMVRYGFHSLVLVIDPANGGATGTVAIGIDAEGLLMM